MSAELNGQPNFRLTRRDLLTRTGLVVAGGFATVLSIPLTEAVVNKVDQTLGNVDIARISSPCIQLEDLSLTPKTIEQYKNEVNLSFHGSRLLTMAGIAYAVDKLFSRTDPTSRRVAIGTGLFSGFLVGTFVGWASIQPTLTLDRKIRESLPVCP